MTEIHLVPCLKDNYAYILHEPRTRAVAVVDPSEAAPVIDALRARGLALTHILNTHHHFDHTGGNLELKERTGARIIGPRADADRIPGIDIQVGQGDLVAIGTAIARVYDIPAHTRGHIAFWFEEAKAVFTGDTMFAMGCGRLFEGTPDQMWQSLSTLARLPADTRVYCGHEYTQSNGRFALSLEPGNADLVARMKEVDDLRQRGLPTIPSTIGLELKTNPFLRPDSDELRRTLKMERAAVVEVFAETRRRKDVF
ncbi:MAG: hydroxyacylglutathione hydrolase [Alphaproteobacteria bacterium]|nr:hydroxyacylglutathione hydrolase [Alphaproteobacteria bacterium]